MKRILNGMISTMNSVKPPRITALQDLHDAEDHGPFSILIGTILSARTKDESTTRIVKDLFKGYKNAKQLANALNALSLFVFNPPSEFAKIAALLSAKETCVFFSGRSKIS